MYTLSCYQVVPSIALFCRGFPAVGVAEEARQGCEAEVVGQDRRGVHRHVALLRRHGHSHLRHRESPRRMDLKLSLAVHSKLLDSRTRVNRALQSGRIFVALHSPSRFGLRTGLHKV